MADICKALFSFISNFIDVLLAKLIYLKCITWWSDVCVIKTIFTKKIFILQNNFLIFIKLLNMFILLFDSFQKNK